MSCHKYLPYFLFSLFIYSSKNSRKLSHYSIMKRKFRFFQQQGAIRIKKRPKQCK